MAIAEDVCRTLSDSIGARPLGTAANETAIEYLRSLALRWGFDVRDLSFDCLAWRHGASAIQAGSDTQQIFAGPFSPPLHGRYQTVVVETIEDLRRCDISGRLLVLRGAIAGDAIMPKDFPFYFPTEHKEIIDLLQTGHPAGIVALTGKHPLCGLKPFPLFEDGNLGIPNAYTTPLAARTIPSEVEIDLRSEPVSASGRQLVFSTPVHPAGVGDTPRHSDRIVVCAHMDTKYNTPGSLDNAAGVAVLMAIMERLSEVYLPFTVEFVPFNGEEYFGVSGQLEYLRYRDPQEQPPLLVINIDGVGHRESVSAVSLYNFGDAATARIADTVEAAARAEMGEQWIAGDHSMFAFQGVPCIAVTSSNLMETVVELTHTTADTIDNVDLGLLEQTADLIFDVLLFSRERPPG